ncbi:MAG: glycosyltransferase [Candidatus Cloacimonetes bacterium]|nr:glycosyltransferase [Candidatus Cloacimonadota bacterium]MDD3532489.1 glycosyltransferase [Candidatus Cloacimonadota bacterium]
MRVIFINSIFPNPVEPNKGNFVLKNIRFYPANIELEVIAPVPFGLALRRGKKLKVPYKRIISLESRELTVYHPRFVMLPRNLIRPLVPFIEYLCVLPLLKKLIRHKKIDLLHANFAMPDGIATRLLAQKLGIPYVVTEHQAALKDFLAKRRLKKLFTIAYRDAYKVIAVSEHTRKIIFEAAPELKNLCVIPNGIDPMLFRQVALPSKSINKLIYIGYLVEHKGVHILLKAIQLIGDSELHLSIVGDGEYAEKLKSLCSEYSIESQVIFLGEKTPAEVAELLANHDALVHPSFIESFGIVVIEALASGIPVVATYNGGSEHILKPEHGILVPPKDAQALAEGIIELRQKRYDPKLLRDYVVENYSLENVVRQTLQEYPAPRATKCICHLSSVHIRSDVRVFYKQCISLVEEGYKVHLVVADGGRHERKSGVVIHDIGAFKSRKKRFFRAPWKIMQRARYIPADAYQIHDPELIPMAILLKYISRKPVVYDIHECYPEMFLHKEYLSPQAGKLLAFVIRRLERWAVRYFDVSIAATEHISEQFSSVPVVHNYPILAEWKDVSLDQSRYHSRNICYVGNITRERGIGQIVKAIEHIDCKFHLAGNYEPQDFRDELIKFPGFSKVIEYGYVNREKAAEIFSECALGVVLFDRSPNHLYSLSTKMFEYMAAGLPILVSDLPENRKLLDRAVAGLYIDSSDVSLIEAALKNLLSQPEKLAQMGAEGKRLVTQELSWESEREVYLRLYEELL